MSASNYPTWQKVSAALAALVMLGLSAGVGYVLSENSERRKEITQLGMAKVNKTEYQTDRQAFQAQYQLDQSNQRQDFRCVHDKLDAILGRLNDHMIENGKGAARGRSK